MMRPCRCGRAKLGAAYEKSQCWLCWMFLNSVRYARLWDDQPGSTPAQDMIVDCCGGTTKVGFIKLSGPKPDVL
jgi:hypothetical protein